MPNAEEVYRAALQDLAVNGNEKAQMALSLAQSLVLTDVGFMKERVCRELRQANANLQLALGANENSWTRNTDRRIYDAQSNIVQAIEAMTR